MKKTGLFLLILTAMFSFSACRSNKKEKPASEKFISALSFIKSQVAHVDTSLYSVRKIIVIDSVRTDTEYYKREQFKDLAADFLTIPDIAASKYEDRFKEEKQFDETLNRVIISYTPIHPEQEEIQRQEILISPDPSGDKVTNIIIDYFINNKDSSVEKRMLWQPDKSFQVTTNRQFPGKPETNSILKVIWSEDEN